MAVQRKWVIVGCALLIFALAGCHSSTNVVGKWKGKMDLSKEMAKGKDKNDPGAQLGAAMANAFGSMISLEIKPDNTFSMTLMMFPMTGKWSVSGDTVSLTPESFMGMSKDQLKSAAKNKGGSSGSQDMDKPMKLKISPDGQKLTAVPDKPGEPEMVFERDKS